MRRIHVLLFVLMCATMMLQAVAPVDFGRLVENSRNLCREKQQYAGRWMEYVSRDTRDMDNYDVQYYRINMTLDFETGSIIADNIIEVMITEDNTQSIELEFDDSLQITDLQVDEATASFTHEDRELVVTLSQTYNEGDVVSINVKYQGSPVIDGYHGGGLYFATHGGEPIAFTFVQPCGAPQWFPCKDVPNDKANTVDIWMTVPDDYELAANGLITEEVDNGDGTKTVKYHESYPIATYLISIACTNYDIQSYTYVTGETEMPVHNFVFPEEHDIQVETFQDILEMIDFLSGIYGPYPFLEEKYGHAFVPVFGGAMEHQTCTTFGGALQGAPYYSTVLHELTHQWTGDLITCDTWAYIWLNEGFAEYSETLYTEHLNGFDWYLYHMSQLDTGDLDSKLERDILDSQNEVLDWVVYAKGAWVLHMLRFMLGDEVFFDGVASYTSDPALRYGTATNEDLEAHMEAAAGIELDWYFDQWYYQYGRPEYRYCYYTSVVEDSIKITLSSENTQDEPFDLYVPYNVNTTTGRVWAPGGISHYTLELEGELDSLVWDPGNRILDYGFHNMIPELEAPVRLRDASVMIGLPEFFDPDFAGYYVYRSENGSDWDMVTPEPVEPGMYNDGSAEPERTYYYCVAAVSGEDHTFVGPSSNTVTMESVEFTFDQGILAIDMTANFPESSPMPTDEETDAFYQDILSEYQVTWWDVIEDGDVPLSEMAKYSSIVLYCDDINTIPFHEELYCPMAYMNAGGNLLISSWRHLEDFNYNPYRTMLHFDECRFNNSPDFAGTLAYGGYPVLDVDSEKVELATWNGLLPYVNSITPSGGAEVLYRYDSASDDENWENQTCAIRFAGDYKLYLLGFPLFFIQNEQAEQFMVMVMDDFGEVQDIDGEGIPAYSTSLSNYPNPFNPSTTVQFSLQSGCEIELSIFNVRGQKIKTLANDYYESGSHQIQWDGTGWDGKKVGSGVYLYRLETPHSTISKKMLLLQ